MQSYYERIDVPEFIPYLENRTVDFNVADDYFSFFRNYEDRSLLHRYFEK